MVLREFVCKGVYVISQVRICDRFYACTKKKNVYVLGRRLYGVVVRICDRFYACTEKKNVYVLGRRLYGVVVRWKRNVYAK